MSIDDSASAVDGGRGSRHLTPAMSTGSSVVRDLQATSESLSSLLQSGSLMLTSEEDSESQFFRQPESTGNGAVPYLDVMTVNTSQFPQSMDGDMFGDHTRLLIEPVTIPSLEHTGVNIPYAAQSGKKAKREHHRHENLQLFYADGGRNMKLQRSIKEALQLPNNLSSKQSSLSSLSVDDLHSGGSAIGPVSVRQLGAVSTRRRRRGARRQGAHSRSKLSTGASLERSSRGPLASVRSSRAGARQRTREAQEVMRRLHDTLTAMDRAVAKA